MWVGVRVRVPRRSTYTTKFWHDLFIKKGNTSQLERARVRVREKVRERVGVMVRVRV